MSSECINRYKNWYEKSSEGFNRYKNRYEMSSEGFFNMYKNRYEMSKVQVLQTIKKKGEYLTGENKSFENHPASLNDLNIFFIQLHSILCTETLML